MIFRNSTSRYGSGLIAVLVLMGAGWGITLPLAKIAVSEDYRHVGLIFWQLVVGALTIGTIRAMLRIRRDAPPFRLRTDRDALTVYVVIALVGTLLPNAASFEAARHLPAGLISILLSLVPMFAFPLALLLGNERFAPLRLLGLLFGLVGVLLITLPEASLPDRAMLAFIPLALIAPFFYGLEGNIVARFGTAGLGPIDVLFGASLVGAVLALPVAIATGEFIDPRPPYGAPDLALFLSSVIHVLVYTAYVWTVGRAGPVFAVQVSYLVTLFGVFWAMALLGERFSGWVWLSLPVIFAGVFLVQPQQREPLAGARATEDNRA